MRWSSQLSLNPVDRGEHAGISRTGKLRQGNQQGTGIDRVAAIILHKALLLLAPAFVHNLVVDLCTDVCPRIFRRREASIASNAQGPVESHPAHHAGVDKMLVSAAHLPDSLICALPVFTEPVELLTHVNPAGVRHIFIVIVDGERIHHLSIDIQLLLGIGPVADTHGLRLPVAFQVIKSVLRHIVSTMDGVHGLE